MFSKIYDFIKKFMKENLMMIILLIIVILLVFVKVPYQVEMPGGIIDLGNRVSVNGEEVSIEGTFNMAYVSVVQGSIPHVLLGLILPDWEVVSDDDVMYENETIEDSNTRDRLSLEQSKDYAISTALDAAGIEYTIDNKVNYVAYIATEADTDLKIGDNILKCNGEEMVELSAISETINSMNDGDIVTFTVLRDGKELDVDAKVYTEDDKKYVGISVITTFDIESDLDIEIDSKSTESGSSGGLMMSLMVYNAITNQDLTHGKKIVGTGTISLDGTVGSIGGVKYKLMGAVKNKADIFLVPAGENYEEALEVKEEKGYDITIVAVSTLQDAIDYLEGL